VRGGSNDRDTWTIRKRSARSAPRLALGQLRSTAAFTEFYSIFFAVIAPLLTVASGGHSGSHGNAGFAFGFAPTERDRSMATFASMLAGGPRSLPALYGLGRAGLVIGRSAPVPDRLHSRRARRDVEQAVPRRDVSRASPSRAGPSLRKRCSERGHPASIEANVAMDRSLFGRGEAKCEPAFPSRATVAARRHCQAEAR